MKELLEEALRKTQYNTADPYLPTRLIDVDYGDKPSEPRLVISKNHPPLTNNVLFYIALSYLWGPGEAQVKTKKDIINDHLTKIKYHTLPKTLMDAVRVCRALGVRYKHPDDAFGCDIPDSPWNSRAGLIRKLS